MHNLKENQDCIDKSKIIVRQQKKRCKTHTKTIQMMVKCNHLSE